MSEVARAVGKAILKRLDQFPCCDVSAGLGYLEGVQGVDLELELGRAALEAIREPSEEMRHAAKIWPTAPDSFEQDVVMGNMDGVEIFRAMIDAALPPR